MFKKEKASFSLVLFYAVHILTVAAASFFILYCVKDGFFENRVKLGIPLSLHSLCNILATIFVLSALLFAAFALLRIVPASNGKKKHSGLLLASWIIYFVSVSLSYLRIWGIKRFPIHSPEIVLFTLSNVRGG